MIVFPREDFDATAHVAARLIDKMGDAIWWEGREILPGDNWDEMLDAAFDDAGSILACFGPLWLKRSRPGMFERRISKALERKKRIVPVLIGGLEVADWVGNLDDLRQLRRVQAVTLSRDRFDSDVERLADGLMRQRERGTATTATTPVNPDDPHHGQWGRKSSNGRRTLSADVRELSESWFGIVLSVDGTTGAPLLTPVTFHLHPTFKPPTREVEPVDGRATLTLGAWGAFTVGVEADAGATHLELDLASDSRFPEPFRLRCQFEDRTRDSDARPS